MLHKVSSFHWEPVGSEKKLTMERKHRNAVGFLFPKRYSETKKKKNCQESNSPLKLPWKQIRAGPVDQAASTTPMGGCFNGLCPARPSYKGVVLSTKLSQRN